MTREIIHLDPCPFCGGIAVLVVDEKDNYAELEIFHKHGCYMELFEPRRHSDPAKLVAMWNRRCR